MKDFISKAVFIFFDISIIVFSIVIASFIRDKSIVAFNGEHLTLLSNYLEFYPLYIIPIIIFAYEGVYTYRYDFWHESRIIIKAIFLSSIIIFAYLGMTQSVEEYSRFVIGLTFLCMVILIPLSKNISKRLLYRFGLWQKKAKVYGRAYLT